MLFLVVFFLRYAVGESGMGPGPGFLLGSQPLAILLLVSVYLILLFNLVAFPLPFFCVFFLLYDAFVVLDLAFLPGMYSAANSMK